VTRYPPAEISRALLGALVGIAISGASARFLPGTAEALPWLIAPMGASAVLLFAVPASPLAQPWPVFGGNVISSAIGLAAYFLLPDPLLAAAVGVSVAIAVMMVFGCLHPPGGACALLAATATQPIDDQGFWFLLAPVAINTAALLFIAWAFNNAIGRSYPHRPAPAPSPTALGVQLDDIRAAMDDATRLDVLPGDVVALLRDAETRALDRRLGRLPVEAIMDTDIATVLPWESIYRARAVIVQRSVKSLPVVDEERRVIGIVSIIDLFTRDVVELEPVEDMMTTDVTTIRAETHVADLIPLMTAQGYKILPVVDADDHLVGLITRGTLIAVLHRALLGE